MKKFWVATLCVLALFYFDAKDREVSHAGNNHQFGAHSSLVFRTRNFSLRSFCVVVDKKGRRRMKCPICDKWVKTLETRDRKDKSTYRRYECANLHRFSTREKVERISTIIKKGKA